MSGRSKSDAGASLFILLGLSLDRDSSQPLSDQLSEQIASAISGGRLAAGTPMPSTRILADKAAFEKLIAEGYLVSVACMNTVVASGRPTAASDMAEGYRRIRPIVTALSFSFADAELAPFNAQPNADDLKFKGMEELYRRCFAAESGHAAAAAAPSPRKSEYHGFE